MADKRSIDGGQVPGLHPDAAEGLLGGPHDKIALTCAIRMEPSGAYRVSFKPLNCDPGLLVRLVVHYISKIRWVLERPPLLVGAYQRLLQGALDHWPERSARQDVPSLPLAAPPDPEAEPGGWTPSVGETYTIRLMARGDHTTYVSNDLPRLGLAASGPWHLLILIEAARRKLSKRHRQVLQQALGGLWDELFNVPLDGSIEGLRRINEITNEILEEALTQRPLGADGGYPATLQHCQFLAAQGDPNAQFRLALMYDNGQGVSQNHREAAGWYRQAAEQGIAEAQFRLGLMYDNGLGVMQDLGQAANWYHRAAEQGLPAAQSGLGLCYACGRGVPLSYVLAYVWLDLAASKGENQDAGLAARLRTAVGDMMSREQVAEARRLAREWRRAKRQRR